MTKITGWSRILNSHIAGLYNFTLVIGECRKCFEFIFAHIMMKTFNNQCSYAFINSIHRDQSSFTSFEQYMYLVCQLGSINDVIMLYNTLFIIFISKYINKYDGNKFLTFHFSQIVTSSLTSLHPVLLLGNGLLHSK